MVATGLAIQVSCSDPSGADRARSDGSLEFSAVDTELDFAAVGDLDFDIEGRPMFEDWAVAADPDSLGGIIVTAFETSNVDGVGNLFILQLQPATSGLSDPCGPNEACRGRLFLGWHTNYTGYDEWLEVTSGTVEIEELSQSRVRGTFALTLRNEGGEGDKSYGIFNGRFDVPVDEGVGTFIACLPPAEACTAGLDAEVVFLTQNKRPDAAMEALFIGQVARDSEGCLRQVSSEGATIIWPRDFSLFERDGDLLLLDDEKQEVGRLGEDFELAGGTVLSLHPGLPISDDTRRLAQQHCPGSYWLVNDG